MARARAQLNTDVSLLMDYLRFRNLYYEFAAFVEELHTLYLDSLSGYSVLHDRIQDHQAAMAKLLGDSELAEEEFQDTCSMLYGDLCGKDFMLVARSPVMKQGKMKLRLKDDGINTLLLGRQCLVSAYAYWEEYLRPAVGKALGVLQSDSNGRSQESRDILNTHVREDFWGDIRYIRNSIVHNNGVANSDISKCKILRWFQPGDPVQLRLAHMSVIFLGMGYYRNWLNESSYEKKYIKFPPRHNEG